MLGASRRQIIALDSSCSSVGYFIVVNKRVKWPKRRSIEYEERNTKKNKKKKRELFSSKAGDDHHIIVQFENTDKSFESI